MTLSEWFHLTHGYDLSSAGGDELADALRADGYRVVKLEGGWRNVEGDKCCVILEELL